MGEGVVWQQIAEEQQWELRHARQMHAAKLLLNILVNTRETRKLDALRQWNLVVRLIHSKQKANLMLQAWEKDQDAQRERVVNDWRAIATTQQNEIGHMRTVASSIRLEAILLSLRSNIMLRAMSTWVATVFAMSIGDDEREAVAALSVEREARRISEREYWVARSKMETRIVDLESERDQLLEDNEQLQDSFRRLQRRLEQVTGEKIKLEARAVDYDRELQLQASAIRSAILSSDATVRGDCSSSMPSGGSPAAMGTHTTNSDQNGDVLDADATFERATLRRKAADLEADNALLTQNFILLKARMSERTTVHEREIEEMKRKFAAEVRAVKSVLSNELGHTEAIQYSNDHALKSAESLMPQVQQLKGLILLHVAERARPWGGNVADAFYIWRFAMAVDQLHFHRASAELLRQELQVNERRVTSAEERAAGQEALAIASNANADARLEEMLQITREMGALREKLVETEKIAETARAERVAAEEDRRVISREKDDLWRALQESRLTAEREIQQRQSSRLILDAQELRNRLETSEKEREQLLYSQAQMRSRLISQEEAHSRLHLQRQQAQQASLLAQQLVASRLEASRVHLETPRTSATPPRSNFSLSSPFLQHASISPESLSRYQVSFSLQ